MFHGMLILSELNVCRVFHLAMYGIVIGICISGYVCLDCNCGAGRNNDLIRTAFCVSPVLIW